MCDANKLSIDRYNAAAETIGKANDALLELDGTLTAAEMTMLAAIESGIIDLGLALRRRLTMPPT